MVLPGSCHSRGSALPSNRFRLGGKPYLHCPRKPTVGRAMESPKSSAQWRSWSRSRLCSQPTLGGQPLLISQWGWQRISSATPQQTSQPLFQRNKTGRFHWGNCPQSAEDLPDFCANFKRCCASRDDQFCCSLEVVCTIKETLKDHLATLGTPATMSHGPPMACPRLVHGRCPVRQPQRIIRASKQ